MARDRKPGRTSSIENPISHFHVSPACCLAICRWQLLMFTNRFLFCCADIVDLDTSSPARANRLGRTSFVPNDASNSNSELNINTGDSSSARATSQPLSHNNASGDLRGNNHENKQHSDSFELDRGEQKIPFHDSASSTSDFRVHMSSSQAHISHQRSSVSSRHFAQSHSYPHHSQAHSRFSVHHGQTFNSSSVNPNSQQSSSSSGSRNANGTSSSRSGANGRSSNNSANDRSSSSGANDSSRSRGANDRSRRRSRSSSHDDASRVAFRQSLANAFAMDNDVNLNNPDLSNLPHFPPSACHAVSEPSRSHSRRRRGSHHDDDDVSPSRHMVDENKHDESPHTSARMRTSSSSSRDSVRRQSESARGRQPDDHELGANIANPSSAYSNVFTQSYPQVNRAHAREDLRPDGSHAPPRNNIESERAFVNAYPQASPAHARESVYVNSSSSSHGPSHSNANRSSDARGSSRPGAAARPPPPAAAGHHGFYANGHANGFRPQGGRPAAGVVNSPDLCGCMLM